MKLIVIEKPVDKHGNMEYMDQELVRAIHYEVFDIDEKKVVATFVNRHFAIEYMKGF